MGQTSQTQAPVNAAPTQNSLTAFFSGKKTYTIAGAMIVYALLGLYLKDMPSSDAITTILQALAIAGLRLGIKKAELPV